MHNDPESLEAGLSARDVIADQLAVTKGYHPCRRVFGSGWRGPDDGFAFTLTASQREQPAADAIIEALTAAGYRIIGPDEGDSREGGAVRPDSR